MSAIFAIVGGLVSLIVWWVKHRETPQEQLRRIVEETRGDMERVDEAIAGGDTVDIAAEFARLRYRILRETAGVDHRGSRADKD